MNIEKYLILHKYLLSLFGVCEFKELQSLLAEARVGYDSNGRSYFINLLISLASLKTDLLPEELLLQYDKNIQSYVQKISYRRDPINLKYFQYLAILFTEYVLDHLKNNKNSFIAHIKHFLTEYVNETGIRVDSFNENELRKLAFWMATGSGKTLIAHINYYQFFYYHLFSPDSILFITPNEGLSKQHLEELQKSGIPCSRYDGNFQLHGLIHNEKRVLVIEMTKFVEEKKGGGVTLPVEVFEGQNLIFVDEGHKGRKSEEQKWARLRDKLAGDAGFVFEYSATFGQILGENNKETLTEYAKAIVFDYSYKYFYLDGYGKDFSVLNVRQSGFSEKHFQETMFVANLLSFYEQLLVYQENISLARGANLEKPLWIFVGTTVTGNEEQSDVVQIIKFMKRVMEDDTWVAEKIKCILSSSTNLKDENGRDIFFEKFQYLKRMSFDIQDLYQSIFRGKGKLEILDLRDAEGEFGLKIGENPYFGVISIGDSSEFKKLLEKNGISVEQDAISSSLFEAIKREDSSINILIGAKKFIEGWDTWRVSSMGLLNIGRGRGPQIIQLFGRGVRLKGKGMSLKRSESETDNPTRFLETLNIYGFKADYIEKFLESIRKEEVEYETIEIPIEPQNEEKWNSLYTLTKKSNKRFEESEIIRIDGIDHKIYFTIDLLPRLSSYVSRERDNEGIVSEQVMVQVQDTRFEENMMNLFDWDRIWIEINEFKLQKGYWNLILNQEGIKNILLSDIYKISVLPEDWEIKNHDDVKRLESIALMVIKKYLDVYYRKFAKQFETKNLLYTKIGTQQVFSSFEKPNSRYTYILQIDKNDKQKKELIKNIRGLINHFNELKKNDQNILPRIYFSKHLYIPILLHNTQIDKIVPPALIESEQDFLFGLRDYFLNNKEFFNGVEFYLLRNIPVSGVGFYFHLSGFYPDFIMWVKSSQKEIIVFIDPKGLEHTKGLDDEKIKLHEDIKILENEIGNKDIVLESFILSKTEYNKIIKGMTKPPSKEEYEENHVLFLDDQDWQKKFFQELEYLNKER